jgi:hypothetical protein
MGSRSSSADRIDHEPGEVVGIEPVAKIGREEHRLVAVAAAEVLSHASSSACKRRKPRGSTRASLDCSRCEPARLPSGHDREADDFRVAARSYLLTSRPPP